MRDGHWPAGAYAAEFADERHFAGALGALHDQGYRRMEVYTPYHVERAEAAIPARRSPLPWIVFIAGSCGGAAAYWVQWFTDAVSYPLNIGGRPAHAVPAFIIPTFETIVLAGALAAFVGLLAVLRLPQPWHPMFEVEGFDDASIDRFWIAIDASDERSSPESTPRELQDLLPLRVVRVSGTDEKA
jgi:hypothetical protein